MINGIAQTYSVCSALCSVMFSVVFYRKPCLEVEVDASAQGPTQAPTLHRLTYIGDMHVASACILNSAFSEKFNLY